MNNPNTVKMNKNGKLVIMQVSDPQDMKYVRKAMVKMLDKAYDKVKPDLVLFTGDNILGNHLLDARIGNRQIAQGKEATYEIMKASINHICAPLEKRNIPFAMIYGNHDDRNLVSKDEQADIYRSYSCCLPMNDGANGLDCDTYNIPVLSSDGSKTVFNLWMLDSAWYDKEADRTFEEVKKETVEWYKATSAQLRDLNGGKNVDSLMFLHIPLPETENLVEPCMPDDEGAVKFAHHPLKGWRRLKPDMARGVISEGPCMLSNSNGLFDAVLECGDVRAIVTGHDHLNSFEGNYKGVDFIQTACASFRCYGNNCRGVRVFVIDENNPADYVTYTLDYFEICGNGIPETLRYYWDADEHEKKKLALLGSAGAAAAAGIIYSLVKRRKR